VDLAGGLDEVLEMGAGEEVAEVDEFAMPLILDVDGSPAVLSCGHILAIAKSVLRLHDTDRCTHPLMFIVCSEPTTAKGMMDLI